MKAIKSHTFYLTTFQTPIYFMTNCTSQEFIKKIRKKKFSPPPDSKEVEGLTIYSEEIMAGALWIRTPDLLDTLFHECMHLVFYIFQHRNIKITEDTIELYALHVQDVNRAIRDWLKKRKQI